MDNIKTNIYDISNYKKNFDVSQYKSYTKLFIELINEFIVHLCDKILFQNQSKYLFVIQRGVETINHIFKTIILYTKNIELTIYHCKRAYIYYVEFIGQIGDDKNTYLQLNSKDATLFVYKKTIFELNNDYRKTFVLSDRDKQILEIINNINQTYIQIFLHILSSDKITSSNCNTIVLFASKTSNKIIEKLLNYKISPDVLLEKINVYSLFVKLLGKRKMDSVKYANIMECFIKKLKKQDITERRLQEKIYSNNFDNIVDNYPPYKCILWLFS